MKRKYVIDKLRKRAQEHGLEFREVELTNHTGFIVGGHRSTLGRHSEIDNITVMKFYKQYEVTLGKGWWK